MSAIQVTRRLVAVVIAAGVPCMVQTADAADDLDAVKATVNSGNEVQLRELANREPSTSMSQTALREFFVQQDLAALRLRDYALRERILRRWIASATDNWDPRVALSFVLIEAGRRAEATAIRESLVRDAVRPNDKVETRANLAIAYLENQNYGRAHELLTQADEVVRSDFGQLPLRGAAAHWRAVTLSRYFEAKSFLELSFFRFKTAIEFCQLTIQQVQTQLDTGKFVTSRDVRFAQDRHLNAYLRLMQIQMAAGQNFEAENAARRALELVKVHQLERKDTAYLYRRLSELRFAQELYGSATQFAEKALQVLAENEIGPTGPDVIWTTQILQRILVAQAKWSEALESFDRFDKQLSADRNATNLATGGNFYSRAATYIVSGRAEKIERALQRGVQSNGETFGADHFQTGFARGLYGLALAASGDPVKEAQARLELGRAVAAITAQRDFGEGNETQSDRKLIRKLILEKYLELEGAQVSSDGNAAACKVADFIRGSSVQQAVHEAAARGAAGSAGLADIVRRDQDASNEMRGLYAFMARQSGESEARRVEAIVSQMKTRIADLEKLRLSLQADIARQFPDYERLVRPQPPSPADIAAQLGEDEVFVSLLPTDAYVYVWAVDRRGTSFHRATLDKLALEQVIAALRGTLDVAGTGAKIPTFDASSAYALYAKLLEPVQARLVGAKHLIVAPSGALGQIPFGVLLTQPWHDGGAEEAPWLIRQFGISHEASASAWMALKRLNRDKRAAEPFMAWADPLFDRSKGEQTARSTGASPVRSAVLYRRAAVDLEREAPRAKINYAEVTPLPETRDEIEAIARTLKANPANDTIFGGRATRESVLAASKSGQLARKQVIAFATHGLVAGDLPHLNQPALAMAATGREPQDPTAPLLTLEDVMGLKLNADWVLLSACNTAAADGRAEEALSGLARGFFYAGARSVLVTHWSVESESARLITTATFSHYTTSAQISKAESLRQAMLSVMSMPAYSHPAYWAPYALVGDGGR